MMRRSTSILAPWAAFLCLACSGDIHSPEGAGGDAPPSGQGDTGSATPDADRGADGALGDLAGDGTGFDTVGDGSSGPDGSDAGSAVVAEHWDPYCTKELFPDFQPELADPNCFVQEALFTCSADAPAAASPARIRRILRPEMVRASGMRLDSDLGRNPFEPPAQLAYPTYDAGVTVDSVTLDLYMNVLQLPGEGWTNPFSPRISYTYAYGGGGGPPVDSCIWQEGPVEQACRDQWTTQFLEGGLLFRPPTDDEIAFISGLLDDALEREATSGVARAETLSFVVSAAWLSPEALFRTEFGQAAPDAQGRHMLTDEERGLQLAYMLTDRGPGAPATHTSTGGWHTGWSNAIEGDRVAYLTDIRAAVADGSIQDPATVRQIIGNHLGGNNTDRPDLHVEFSIAKTSRRGAWFLAPKVRDFFRYWLGYLPASTAYKDTPQATSRITAEGFDGSQWAMLDNPYATVVASSYVGNLSNSAGDNEATLVQQMDDFIARVVMGGQDVFKELLTARTYRVPSSRPGDVCSSDADCSSKCFDGRCYGSTWMGHRYSALVYDVLDPIEDTVAPATDERWVEMAASDRAGVLTHPAWLAAHGDNFEDGQSAIYRGRWMREKLFCQHVPPLTKVPAGVEVMLPPGHPDLSARDRIKAATDNAYCGRCHVRMNDLGFPFEQYNHAGFVRVWDRDEDPNVAQGPVDSSTTLAPAGSDGAVPDPSLQGQSFSSAVELMLALSKSEVTKRCFIRHAFRYFVGRDETLADACTLTDMEAAYDEQGAFGDLLVALANSDTMRYRTRPEAPESLVCE